MEPPSFLVIAKLKGEDQHLNYFILPIRNSLYTYKIVVKACCQRIFDDKISFLSISIIPSFRFFF